MFKEVKKENTQKRKRNAEEKMLNNKKAKISELNEDPKHIRKSSVLLPQRKTGTNDCRCRINCFHSFMESEKRTIINFINNFDNKFELDCYLQGLITITENNSSRKRSSQKIINNFKVSINGVQKEVCKNTYISLHGISSKIVKRLIRSLLDGLSPFDRRILNGQHNMIPDDVCHSVQKHILSIVPEPIGSIRVLTGKLNLKQMTQMFNERWPEYNVTYSTYRKIFKNIYDMNSEGLLKKRGEFKLYKVDSVPSKENKSEFNNTFPTKDVKVLNNSDGNESNSNHKSHHHPSTSDGVREKPKKFYIKLNLQKKIRKNTII